MRFFSDLSKEVVGLERDSGRIQFIENIEIDSVKKNKTTVFNIKIRQILLNLIDITIKRIQ